MDYSEPPRRQRPSRYPALAPYEDRYPPTGRPPWDDEPWPASSGAYGDTFNGGSPDTFSAGFSDAFGGGSSTGGFGQAPSTGSFRQAPSTGGFSQAPSTGGFSQAPSTGGFGQAPSTGGFGQAGYTGPFSPADTVADLRPVARGGARRRLSIVQLLAGAVAGFLAAAVALGVANLTAAFVRPQASPIIAVGGAFIDRTPPALKNFAVEKFGENDKNMLLLGMYVTVALIAIVIGVLAWRRLYIGVAGIGLFGLFGAFVAFTRPESHLTDVIPSLVGGIAGMVAVVLLIRAGTRRTGGPPRFPDPVPGYQNDGWAV
jgi:hypothetical protein